MSLELDLRKYILDYTGIKTTKYALDKINMYITIYLKLLFFRAHSSGHSLCYESNFVISNLDSKEYESNYYNHTFRSKNCSVHPFYADYNKIYYNICRGSTMSTDIRQLHRIVTEKLADQSPIKFYDINTKRTGEISTCGYIIRLIIKEIYKDMVTIDSTGTAKKLGPDGKEQIMDKMALKVAFSSDAFTSTKHFINTDEILSARCKRTDNTTVRTSYGT